MVPAICRRCPASFRTTPRRSRATATITCDVYGFLTTEPNAVIALIHPKAVPVILTTDANSFESAFTIVRYCGAAHLLYLAYRLWGAIPDSGEPHTEKHIKDLQKETLGGLALELGNPKTIAFYVALFPNLLELTEASSWDYLLLFAFTLAIYLFAFGTYILLAVRSRRILRSASAATLVNRGASVAIAGAAIVVATRR